MINKEYYRDFVKGFCEKIKELPEDTRPLSGIFIPYTFNNYTNAAKKIFFVGVDSAGWIKTKEMLNDFDNHNIDDYLEKNSKVVTVQGVNKDGTDSHSLKENTSWRCNSMSKFWPFCQKLYIYVMTGEWVDVTNFKQEHYDLLEGAGYGNLSLVEIKEGWLNRIHKHSDCAFAGELHSYANAMENFENIIKAYNTPDLIVVLGQRGRRDVLNGLDAKQISTNEYADVFELGKYSTKIIWTSHPSARRKTKAFRDGVLPYLGNTAKELLGI